MTATNVSRPCPECGAALAAGQRYCLECGKRIRALPANVALYIEAIEGRHRDPAFVTAIAEPDDESGLAPFLPFAMPSPRAAAVAVLGALAFGTLLGSGSDSLASSPLIVLMETPRALAQSLLGSSTVTTPSAASSGGGGAAPGTTSVADNSGTSGPSSSAATPSTTSTSPTATTTTTSTGAASVLPPTKHVFVIVLADQGYATSLSPASKDKYLSKTLAAKGEIVPNYYGVAQGELANEIAMISGQGPTVQTAADCPSFTTVAPGKRGSDGQVLGDGCVYPKATPTLATQLTAAHHTWKAYVEGLGVTAAAARDGRRTHERRGKASAKLTRRARAHAQSLAANCRYPKLGAADQEQAVSAGNDYVTWRNPFVYFQSITSSKDCQSEDVGIPQLATDLKSESTTPSVAFITPGPCDDGSDTPCRRGAPAGTSQSDKFLESVVPEILGSPAYKDDGMLIITFDQAPQAGPNADPSSCCNNPTYPNLPAATQTTTTTSGATTSSTATGTTTTETTSTTADTTTTAAASSTSPESSSTSAASSSTTPVGSSTASASSATSGDSTDTSDSAATTSESTSSGDGLTESTTTGDAPTESTTTGDAPTESTTSGDAPTESTTSGDAPTESTTSGDAPTESMTIGSTSTTSTTSTTAAAGTGTGAGTGTTTTSSEITSGCSSSTTTSSGTASGDSSSTTTSSDTTSGDSNSSTASSDTTSGDSSSSTASSDTTSGGSIATTTGSTTTATTATSTGATTSPGTSSSSSSSSTTTAASTCTSTPSLPTGLLPGETAGGGQVGMLVISSYVIPKSTDDVDQANHFSLLALIEDLFSLKPIGYASSASTFSTGATGLFNNYSG